MALFDGMTQDEIGEVLAKYWNDNPGTFEQGLIDAGIQMPTTRQRSLADPVGLFDPTERARDGATALDNGSITLTPVGKDNERFVLGTSNDLGFNSDYVQNIIANLEASGNLPPNQAGLGWELHGKDKDGNFIISHRNPDSFSGLDLLPLVVGGIATAGLGGIPGALLKGVAGTMLSGNVDNTSVEDLALMGTTGLLSGGSDLNNLERLASAGNFVRQNYVDPDDIATSEELGEMRDEEFDDTISDWDSWLRTIDTTWEDIDWTPPTTGDQGGGGSTASGGGGGTPGDDEVAKSEKEDRWVWDGSVLVNVETGETQSVPNPSGLEKGKVYNQDAEPYADGEDEEGLVLGQTGWFPAPTGTSGSGTGTGSGSGTETTSGTTGGTSDDGLVTGQQSWEGGSGGGTGGGSGGGTSSGEGDDGGYGPGTPSTTAGRGMFGGGEDEWEDYMSGIHTSFPLLRRRNISPAQYLDALIARINS